MRRWTLPIILVGAALVAALSVVGAVPATAAPAYVRTADLLDAEYLAPHSSPIDGCDLVNNWRWYGVDVLPQLVILGAESSLGDPALGGGSVPSNNFGNIKWAAGRDDTRWQSLATGRWFCPGQGWYLVFPSPELGVMAWGRYLKVGAGGVYRDLINNGRWSEFARIYYGASVPGLGHYTANLYALEARFRERAARFGFAW